MDADLLQILCIVQVETSATDRFFFQSSLPSAGVPCVISGGTVAFYTCSEWIERRQTKKSVFKPQILRNLVDVL